ncbi:TPA: hypothetical protein ACJUFH_002641 [Listeria monocytogenes]|uniref:hypothetical protein n=1 Tax=Listeria monocytogenes TaxID=1639 RepID=UPI00027E87FD|nr:hypothetical protein [Listeria monocytogenes]CBY75876.1 hypothetical protein LMOSLCC2540_1235 [Listeria monocytogenes SLCC2540]HAC3259835.1 hypothetical protein [Listeria monocytogenes]HCW3270347.1 hypothetical protein [Listeria monocytogenes]
MEINIMDYVSEDDIKNTILEAVTSKVRNMQDKHLKIIYTNACYSAVTKVTDEIIEERGLEFSVENKVRELIENLSAFTVFYHDKFAPHENSKAYNLTQRIVEEEKDLLRETIKQLITKAYSEAKVDMDIADLMSAYVRELFTVEGEA